MKVFILGLGSTIHQYKHHKDDITFGVNDIFKFVAVKHLVCVNAVGDFEMQRRLIIKNSEPQTFHSIKFYTNEWTAYFQNVDILNPIRTMHTIDTNSNNIIASSSSNFMAAHLAYKMYPEMKSMYFYGVDFTNHRNISGQRLDKELNCWRWLFTQLTNKGIKIFVPQESRLIDAL